jgi:hypothetical protein
MSVTRRLDLAACWALFAGPMFSLAAIAALAADPGAPPSDQTSAGRADRVVPGAATPRRKEEEKPGERLREGTRLKDVAGSFQTTGDRVAFHPDGKGESYRVLENLALQRIHEILDEGRGTLSWTVSGVVTEFRGSNYVLVTKAVVKTAADSPASGP